MWYDTIKHDLNSHYKTRARHLYGVRIRGLTQNLQQHWVRDEKEAWEGEAFLFQISAQRFLTHLQLFQQVWKQLLKRLISYAALNHAWKLMGSLHYPLPRLINVLETFRLLNSI